jgi:hypothetical protein
VARKGAARCRLHPGAQGRAASISDVYWTKLAGSGASNPIAAPGEGKGRKHPRVALNEKGEVLLAWTEGTGWQKGGSLAYQVYDPQGQSTAEKNQLPGIPAWSFAAIMTRPDNGFTVVY